MLIRSPEQARALLAAAIPPQHVAFLSGLPVLVETDRAVFVHAGLRPGLPLAAQADEDLIWIRDGYRQSYAEFGKCVVHGHTPRELPLVTEFRIAIDTGAFQTGRLTAVRLMEGREPRLFST
jgi:serine/threonine protein phosphatase 1